MPKVINHCILGPVASKRRASDLLYAKGKPIRRDADNAVIARAICEVVGRPIPDLPEDMGRMVIAFASGDLERAAAGPLKVKPYVPPKLPEWQQRRMEEFRAIPSLAF